MGDLSEESYERHAYQPAECIDPSLAQDDKVAGASYLEWHHPLFHIKREPLQTASAFHLQHHRITPLDL